MIMKKGIVQICILLLSCAIIISCANPNGTCNCDNCQCNKPTEESPKEDEKDTVIPIVPFGNYECFKREHWYDHIVERNEDKEYLADNNMTLNDNILVGNLNNIGRINLKLQFEKDGKFTDNKEFTWVYSSNILELHYNFGQQYQIKRLEEIFYYTLKE